MLSKWGLNVKRFAQSYHFFSCLIKWHTNYMDLAIYLDNYLMQIGQLPLCVSLYSKQNILQRHIFKSFTFYMFIVPPRNTNKLTPFVKRVINSFSTIKMHDWHQRMLYQSNQIWICYRKTTNLLFLCPIDSILILH